MKRNMILSFLIAILAGTLIFSLYLPHVKAVNVEITSVLPVTRRAEVGNKVLISGTINTTDGLCVLLFDGEEVNRTHAIGNVVNVTFIVPSLPGGNHTIILRDEETKNTATTGFYIVTAYYITPELPEKPKQIRQNETVILNLTITGGTANISYDINVTVELPPPLNATGYSAVIEINTTDIGYGSTSIAYPDEVMFEPSGSHTNFTGNYNAYFDKIKDRAKTSFFIGLTDASEYHREDLVSITALGYEANKTSSITITSQETNDTIQTLEVNVTQHGIINATWIVPSNVSIGYFNLTIVVENRTKPIKDSQIIRIPGYPIKFHTRNLAGDDVPDIFIEAIDRATNTTYSNTTEADAMTYLSLEKGSHTLEAYWKEVRVNQTDITMTGNRTYHLTCKLTNMKITVEDKEGNLIPFVDLNINYQYNTTKEGKRENGTATGKTEVSGSFSLNSTLPHISYSINASRYERIFNHNNNTLESLPAKQQVNITIICPIRSLTLNITDHHGNPLQNADIEIIEQMGGIHYTETTNIYGVSSTDCTFGRYSVTVYKDDLLLNETFTDLFNDTNVQIHCKLYNLTISVKIVDYFGQVIPGVNVTLQRNGLQYIHSTESEGIIRFSNMVGGNLDIMVYLHEQTQPTVVKSLYIDSLSLIEIKIPKYVVLAGFPVETSQLITALILLLAILLVISLEVYRRRRIKLQKTES